MSEEDGAENGDSSTSDPSQQTSSKQGSEDPKSELDPALVLDALAEEQPLLRGSVCLQCLDHRTIQSGRGSLFLLCQSKTTPSQWPKYPPQPLLACPYCRKGSE